MTYAVGSFWDLALIVPGELAGQTINGNLEHSLGQLLGDLGRVGVDTKTGLLDGLGHRVHAVVGVGGKLVGGIAVLILGRR